MTDNICTAAVLATVVWSIIALNLWYRAHLRALSPREREAWERGIDEAKQDW